MTIRHDKEFKKRFERLPPKTKTQVNDRLSLFANNPKDPRLRLHPLKGEFTGYYSINLSGDLRAIFKRDGPDIIFVLVGTHSQLYG